MRSREPDDPPLPKPLKWALALSVVLFTVAATALDAKRASGWLTMLGLALAAYLWRRFPVANEALGRGCGAAAQRPRLLLGVCAVALLAYLIPAAADEPERLVSFLGLCSFLGCGYALSANRAAIAWRPVATGVALQLLLGAIILKSEPGRQAFEFLGEQVGKFLDYSDAGAALVFGDDFEEHYFFMKVLPTVIYFSAFVSVAQYLGAMQVVVVNIASVLQRALGTSASESLNAAANIFVGQTEAPLVVKDFVGDMTLSELHCVMTGGFATLAGGVLAAYASFGVKIEHLIAASILSAPAALAMSKLVRPETGASKTAAGGPRMSVPASTAQNVVEAAADGAALGVKLAGNILAMLVAFVSLLAFVNGVLGWLGALVDCDDLSFATICGYLFTPVAWLMGVPAADCHTVGELLGVKLFVNEFVAYLQLSDLARDGAIGERAEVLTTYALCGFANFGSIGIQLGGLAALAPARRKDLAKLAVSAMLCGAVACFMTACVAGMLV